MRKGFTLIELLAVITVLAIILIIAIPNIQRLIKKNKEDTFLINAKSIIKQIKYEDKTFTTTTLSELNLEGITKDGYDANLSTAYISDEEIHLNLVGTGQYEGMYLCGVNLSTSKSEVQSTPCEELEKYIVTFDPNGGSVPISNKEVMYNATYGNLPIPKREGYKFLGWNGKNLLNLNNRILKTGEYSNSTNRNYTGNGLYLGLTSNNYFISGTVYEHSVDSFNNNILVKSAGGGYGVGIDCIINPNMKYKLSYSKSNDNLHIKYGLYTSGSSLLTYKSSTSNPINITTTNDAAIITFIFESLSRDESIAFNNIQLEEGDTATEYEPYYVTKDVKVTQRKNHTLTAIWEEI